MVAGDFVDGSGWEEVYQMLKKDGYHHSLVDARVKLESGEIKIWTTTIITFSSRVTHLDRGSRRSEPRNKAKEQ
jgi:hypothetical protein